MRRAKEYHDDDMRVEAIAGYPLMVRLAAIAWIAFGCLIIVTAVAGAVLHAAVIVETPRRAPPQPGQVIVNARESSDAEMRVLVETGIRTGIALVIGGSLFFAGVRTIRGAAKDTLGNAIGVIVLGVLTLGGGGVVMATPFGLPGGATVAVILVGEFVVRLCGPWVGLIVLAITLGPLLVAVGLGLVTAAVFALAGRTQYLAWRRPQGAADTQ
jgi:hypothetical protein